ncbi:MAG: acylphosphatase [Synergistales bacterium]|nr:acylphosphatase [Synergistales bacterium]
MDRIRRHLFLAGMVQGIGFRHTAVHKARELGVAGWVRNLADGRVELVIQGEPTAVYTMESWAERGPRMAVVQHVEAHDEKPSDELTGFDVRF